VVTGAMKRTSCSKLLAELAWEDLHTRRAVHKLSLFFKVIRNIIPKYLSNLYLLNMLEVLTSRLR
jgi:hypothetical protein